MKFNKYLSGIAASAIVVSCATAVSANAMQANTSKFTVADSVKAATKVNGLYIVQMKGAPAIAKASAIGELTPSNQLVSTIGNNYDATTPKMRAYVRVMKKRQAAVASQIGVTNVLHNYAHTFNGFSARLTPAQAKAMKNHPDVAAVYEDELHQLQTSNTPAFLGLTGPGGQHTLGIKGEDVIVGILDSGIWPENPSFSENPEIAEMAYGSAPARWAGECNAGSIGEFTNPDGIVVYNDETMEQNVVECDNKLIGARYFGSSFSSVYEMQFALGEFASARDADGHGSHTASTAAGNAGVTAVLQGADVGTVSGIAPRARVAAYKVCWNSNFVNEAGDAERGCFFGDSMAAIDQAVVDGVDVLNYSIGNSIAINSPVYNAALRAAEAGVFFSASAGNSGPGPNTVNNIAPWIATVAASTYDGESAVIGSLLNVNTGTLAPLNVFSVQAAIGTPVPEDGLSGDLGLADPVLACDPLTVDLTGQIALIARGVCGFTVKMANAEAAGAIGVVVYTDSRTPVAMGGTDPGIGIPGVMVTNADGLLLTDSVSSSEDLVNVTMSNTPAATTATEVGNIMAGFSSRGVNLQTADILKPDITAPGVRILAASSPEQLQFGGNPQGENFAYLQGTSMSSPHIAGMAALLAGQHPSWSPAQIKSAIMTSARQDLVKEDGLTPADPFDFGAGHVDPIPAMNPGLTYNANFGDYLGFLCSQGEEGLVVSLTEQSCAFVEGEGFAVDASQLNYPSIAIGELEGTETVSRTVTDVSNEDGVYTVTVDAPTGINVTVRTFDSEGVETPDSLLAVSANGTASYSLTFDTTPETPFNEWLFGSVTLERTDGIVVRSPIAVNALPSNTIMVPESLSVELNRGRANVFVETLYSGPISVEYAGLDPGAAISGATTNPTGGEFSFNGSAGRGEFTLFAVPEGTTVLRVALADSLVDVAGADLDLHVWNCIAFSCGPVATSINPGSNENIILTNPEPRSGDGGDVYLLIAHATDTAGADTVNYTAPTWIVNGAQRNTRVTTSRRAVANRFQNVSIRTRGLEEGRLYMGSMTFFDADGVSQGTTVLEVQP